MSRNNKNKTFELAQLVLLLGGVTTLMASFFLPPDSQEGLKGILHSLGAAFLASSFIGLFNAVVVVLRNKRSVGAFK